MQAQAVSPLRPDHEAKLPGELIMEKQNPPVSPGHKWFKSLVIKIVFFLLGRSFHSTSKLDPDIIKEIATWEEGFAFMMKIFPNGPRMTVEKRRGILRYRGSTPESADLVITFKSLESAFLLFTAQCGTCQGFAESRFIVNGDIPAAMSLTRCLNIIQGYLFPSLISRLILKRVPPMPFYKQLVRLYIYLVGVPLGL
jgi:hypothetical protein